MDNGSHVNRQKRGDTSTSAEQLSRHFDGLAFPLDSCGLAFYLATLHFKLGGSICKRFDPAIPIDMASTAASLTAQSRRRMVTQTRKGASHLLLFYSMSLHFTPPRNDRIRVIEEQRSKSGTNTQQQA
jgi:hypothetical protein